LFFFLKKNQKTKNKTLKAIFKGRKITKNTCSQKELADGQSHANFVPVKVGSAQLQAGLRVITVVLDIFSLASYSCQELPPHTIENWALSRFHLLWLLV